MLCPDRSETSTIRYYTDILKECGKYGYGWYNCGRQQLFSVVNDDPDTGEKYYFLYDTKGVEAMGLTYFGYNGKELGIPLFECLQQYQNSER